jgi:hypothetical protein
MSTLSMLPLTLGFDGDVTRNFGDIYTSFVTSWTMVFATATKSWSQAWHAQCHSMNW